MNNFHKTLKKYFKVLILFWQSAILAELEYRLNFVIAAITSTNIKTNLLNSKNL